MSVSHSTSASCCNSSLSSSDNAAQLEPKSSASATRATELACAKASVRSHMRQFADFPIPGINFLDIMPLFLTPSVHATLIRALEMEVLAFNNGVPPDVIVGLDARGFLFGPSLALKLGSGFVPVRKRGKLPGPTIEASYVKEYGVDVFEMQKDVITAGQTVLVVDDIIATGGSAQAAGKLVQESQGHLIGYLFLLEVAGLNGRDQLNTPVQILLDSSA
ncbi:hypothetical protein K3495_g3974 [Podosphaera aphanis]|nr:hypothetical protein K3495_g3974 [Podosphaera aphanis]